MQSFNQKTQIDLPDLRKKSSYKNKRSDDFDLLFKNNEEADLIDLRKNKRSKKSYNLYLISGALLITACFLVVQIVTGGHEIEKYRTVTKNIEDIDSEKGIKEPVKIVENNSSIPDVQFEDDTAKPSKQIISKKAVINKTIKEKTFKKPFHIVTNNLKKNNIHKPIQIVKTKSSNIIAKKREIKIQEAISEIMLRPLTVSSEPVLRGSDKNN